ncbi:MAG: hypothetical protein ACJ8DV_19945, partial [Microvirga sp.]
GFFDSTIVAYGEFPELYTVDNCVQGEAVDRVYGTGRVHFNTRYKDDFKNTSYKTMLCFMRSVTFLGSNTHSIRRRTTKRS